MAKVIRHLVRVGILQAERGAKGGVAWAKPPEVVRLPDIV